MIDGWLQSTSKASSAGTTSVFSDKLPKNDSKIHDPFDDDFDIGDGIVSQSNSSSQAATSAASSTFDDEFPVSASQSQCSLAFSPGNYNVIVNDSSWTCKPFYGRQHSNSNSAVRLAICLAVQLSHSGTVSEKLYMGSCSSHLQAVQGLVFETKVHLAVHRAARLLNDIE